jgi:hypothetical protein
LLLSFSASSTFLSFSFLFFLWLVELDQDGTHSKSGDLEESVGRSCFRQERRASTKVETRSGTREQGISAVNTRTRVKGSPSLCERFDLSLSTIDTNNRGDNQQQQRAIESTKVEPASKGIE